MTDIIVKGTPPLLMLPAKNYFFKVYGDKHQLVVPKSGTFKDLDADFYKEEDGSFDLFNSETGTLDLAALSHVLFATKQYPDLDSAQFFVPYNVIVKENELHLLGQVIEIMVPVGDKAEGSDNDTMH